MISYKFRFALGLVAVSGVEVLSACPLQAQAAPAMDHSKMGHAATIADPLGVPMNRAGSGTTWIPDAVQLPTRNFMAGDWHLMVHGFAFAQYNAQLGDRGEKQFGSLNWGMFMASRNAGGGRLQFRSMLSIDAATVGARGYPLLGQSGEVYNGEPVRDRQHPHDFFMELGVSYERPIAKAVGVSLYAAPSGEPALGPVAFMHRPSSMDMPTAPLSHHWQDATHVAFGVVSAGLFTNKIKIEGSSFNSREPDQYRWNFDRINLDSYSGRVTLNPNANWSFTTGYGHLKSPEIRHPTMSMNRLVASAIHGRTIGERGQWSTSFVYGQNTHEMDEGEGHSGGHGMDEEMATRSHSFLLESQILLNDRNTFFGRVESVQKSAEDLDLSSIVASATRVDVRAFSLGYVREVVALRSATFGIGGMGTINHLPEFAKQAYGSRTPVSAVLFARVRPRFKPAASSMPGMDHSKY